MGANKKNFQYLQKALHDIKMFDINRDWTDWADRVVCPNVASKRLFDNRIEVANFEVHQRFCVVRHRLQTCAGGAQDQSVRRLERLLRVCLVNLSVDECRLVINVIKLLRVQGGCLGVMRR